MKRKAEIQCKRKPIIDHESVKGNRFGGSFFAARKALPLPQDRTFGTRPQGPRGVPLQGRVCMSKAYLAIKDGDQDTGYYWILMIKDNNVIMMLPVDAFTHKKKMQL